MVTLFVKVKPGASRDDVHVDGPNSLSVRIKAKPIDGAANDYLVEYLSSVLEISRSRITIEKGATSRVKRIALGMEQKEWEDRIKKL